MELSDRHRRFLLVEQGAVPAVFNLLLNALITWGLFLSAVSIPLWGESSVGVDLLVTAFVLPYLTSVIVSRLVGRDVRNGKVPPLIESQLPRPRWFQGSSVKLGLLLGAVGVLFGAVPLVWALSLGQAQPFPVIPFVAFKATWTAMLAFLLTPIVGWFALVDASRVALRVEAG